jgi:hypothetical protein
VHTKVVHENSEYEDESYLEYDGEESSSSLSNDLERYNGDNFWEHEYSDEDEDAKQYRRHAKMVKKGVKM